MKLFANILGVSLLLSANLLTGTIPAGLTLNTMLDLGSNQLHGTIPSFTQNSKKRDVAYFLPLEILLHYNQFTHFAPDFCMPNFGISTFYFGNFISSVFSKKSFQIFYFIPKKINKIIPRNFEKLEFHWFQNSFFFF